MSLPERMKLANGVIIESRDESKSIVGDRWMVRVRFVITVPRQEWMENMAAKEGVAVAEVCADKQPLSLELVKERVFVAEDSREETVRSIIDEMHANIVKYVELDGFAEKLFLKRLAEAKEARRFAPSPPDDMDEDDGPADFSACFRD